MISRIRYFLCALVVSSGKHSIKLELIDNNVVDKGGYNSTTREINVVK